MRMGPGPGKGLGRKFRQLFDSQPKIKPELLALFDDEDAIHDFLDSCDEHERCIIDKAPDKKVLIQIVKHVQDDVEETSKALEMDG